MHGWYDSPFIVPVAIFTMIAVVSVGGMLFSYFEKKLKVEQRMAAIQRGVPLSEIEKVFAAVDKAEHHQQNDPFKRMKNIRLTAFILIAGGCGLMATCIAISVILQQHEVLAGAAGALIPVAIGIGFWLDYKSQAREMERLGLVAGDE